MIRQESVVGIRYFRNWKGRAAFFANSRSIIVAVPAVRAFFHEITV